MAIRGQGGGKDDCCRDLVDGDSGLLHFVGQSSLDRTDSVLHVYGGGVDVSFEIEGDIDGAGAVIATTGGDVLHAVDAVYLLFQNIGDAGFHGGGIGSDIVCRHFYLGRHYLRILGYWQVWNGDQTGYENN